jgi:hypothetical protein
MKPNNFPLRPSLDGSEELYSQTSGVSQKFTLEEAKKYANAIEVTYAELTNLISGQELIAGSHYIITNFKTCYDRPDYDQFKNAITPDSTSYFQANVEPIIVMATSENTLATDAYQPIYPNDKIKYDINYSTTESGDVAFGRITERIDEWNNRTDYDHRTIQFKRYRFYYYSKETPQTGIIELLNDGTVNGTDTFFTNYSPGDVIVYPNSNEKFFKIESIDSDTLMTVSGLSINPYGGNDSFYTATSGSYDSYYRSNVDDPTDFQLYLTFANDTKLNNYIGDYSSYFLDGIVGDFLLANNVFKDGPYRSNTIGNVSYNNTMNDDCTNNTIGNRFFNNIIDDDFDRNKIADYFNNNIITANFEYNQIGDSFEDNTIINSNFYRNQIGNDFNNNWLDSDWGFDFQNNQIGNQFNSNDIFRDFYKNRILNGYNNNLISREFQGNDVGNGFNQNEIYQDFYDNRIKDYFDNNTIGDSNNIGFGQFGNNVIVNNFKGNSTLGEFAYNQIGNDFVSNTTEDYFISNVIGNGTIANNISLYFAYNKIGNGFQNNTIANDFGFGGGIPRGNVIGNDFNSNNIGEYFYDNIISDNFSSNIIGDDFINNRVSEGFSGNIIGYYFQNNDIKVPVSGNDFIVEQGQLATVTNINTPNGVDNTYTNVSQFSTSGIGQNGTFDITVLGGIVVIVAINNNGYGYVNGDTILINGSQFGGVDGVDNLTLSVDSATTTTFVTDQTSCTIFNDSTFSTKLMYIDGLGTLNVVNVTSQS